MKCQSVCRYISAYIDRDTDRMMDAAVRRHVEECERCLAVLRTMEKTIVLFRQYHRAVTPPDWVVRKVSLQLRFMSDGEAVVIDVPVGQKPRSGKRKSGRR